MRARQLPESRDRGEYLRSRILEVAADADVGRLPVIHERGSGVSRWTRATAARATAAARPGRALLPGPLPERIGHAAALLHRNLLEPRPPLRHRLGREPELRAQQQEIVGCAEARVLEHAQRAAAARVLETWLQREHLAHPEREALGDGDARLRLARRAVAGVQDRGELVPARGRRRLDVLRDGPI